MIKIKNMYKIKEKVLAIIKNQEGKILIGRYSSGNKTWTLPKGGIEDGEDTISALFRELKEELNLDKDSFKIIKNYNDPYVKIFTKEEVENKVKRLGEKYNYNETRVYGILLDFIGDEQKINITITNEFFEYKWLLPLELSDYLEKTMFDFFIKDVF